MQATFLEMSFLEDDRRKLGDDATSAFLVLALAADEIMHLRHMWLMAMNPLPEEKTLRKAARSRSHMLLRLLNLKVVECHLALSGFEQALQRRAKNQSERCTAAKVKEVWEEHMGMDRENTWFKFSRELRNKLGAHCQTSEVTKWLDFAPPKAERRFLFGDYFANDLFIATDDMLFGSYLGYQLSKEFGSGFHQDKFNVFVEWLIDASASVSRAFHEVCILVFGELLEKDFRGQTTLDVDEQFTENFESMKLPIYYHKDV